jgi:spore maturation protein CgeB
VRIVILGLSITSSWGNGHATTYRGLVRELAKRGHDVLFLERDQPWYADNRDLPKPPFGRTELYGSVAELRRRFAGPIRTADAVMLGSYVPDGIEIGEWLFAVASGVTAFYDIDTPVTLAGLSSGDCDYLSPGLISRFDLYLSFTGGSTLETIELKYGARSARALYCSVDPALYAPERRRKKWVLGYLGTFSKDRQRQLNKLLLQPAVEFSAAQFVVAGPQYPESTRWPRNVERIVHLNPSQHRAFYNSQRFTLNITRAAMLRAGFSPSVRLFEAAACGTPIITDNWPGLETFFRPEEDILVAQDSDDVLSILREMPEEKAREIGHRARQRVLARHTAAHRAAELERLIEEVPANEPAVACTA